MADNDGDGGGGAADLVSRVNVEPDKNVLSSFLSHIFIILMAGAISSTDEVQRSFIKRIVNHLIISPDVDFRSMEDNNSAFYTSAKAIKWYCLYMSKHHPDLQLPGVRFFNSDLTPVQFATAFLEFDITGFDMAGIEFANGDQTGFTISGATGNYHDNVNTRLTHIDEQLHKLYIPTKIFEVFDRINEELEETLNSKFQVMKASDPDDLSEPLDHPGAVERKCSHYHELYILFGHIQANLIWIHYWVTKRFSELTKRLNELNDDITRLIYSLKKSELELKKSKLELKKYELELKLKKSELKRLYEEKGVLEEAILYMQPRSDRGGGGQDFFFDKVRICQQLLKIYNLPVMCAFTDCEIRHKEESYSVVSTRDGILGIIHKKSPVFTVSLVKNVTFRPSKREPDDHQGPTQPLDKRSKPGGSRTTRRHRSRTIRRHRSRTIRRRRSRS
jgi:hypothetical protein